MRRIVIILLGVGIAFASFGQGNRFGQGNSQQTNRADTVPGRQRILGDTVRYPYGALTTRYFFEEGLKNNSLIYNHPDTIPDNLHRFTDLERNNNFIQNLGNLGTALRPMFYEPKRVIGRTTGFHAFDEFYQGPDRIRYYDTRSPFSQVSANFGGGGRSTTDVIFAISDSANVGFGFGYNNIRADKQLALLERQDRTTESTNWNIFGHIRPKKLPQYQLLFNLTQFKHTVDESGGIIPLEVQTGEDTLSLFDYQDENVILTDAESQDKRGGIHLFQQYEFDSVFQAYHSMTFMEQVLRFTDAYDLSTSDSLKYIRRGGLSTDQIQNRTAFREFSNEFGFKGRTKRFAYTLYYRLRSLRNDNVLIATTAKDTEHYLGGVLRQQITPKIFLNASGEYLLGGGYLVNGDFSSDFFKATFTRSQSKPSYLVNQYIGQQRDWNNAFDNEVSDNLYARFFLGKKGFRIEPSVRLSRINGYIYWNNSRVPEQASGDVLIASPGVKLSLQLSSKWAWTGEAVYSSVGGGASSTYRIPELMANSQFAYKSVLFNGRMIIHTGLDLHFRSSYRPLDYDPIVQQFFLQDSFRANAFVRADAFINFKVEHFTVFAKMGHFNQGITADGYFLTPYYTGTRRSFDLGLRWSFFD